MTGSEGSPKSGRVLAELRVIDNEDAPSAAMNMAIDEALLEMTTTPILRFYRWRRPSVSFGYFGRFADVADEMSKRELVRRWTGGGIVLHGSDLTYSIIIPRREVEALPAPRVLYNEIHGAIREVLSADIDVALAGEDAPRISDSCFANPVAADVLVAGRKIAGAAQRRTRAGLLHQGSIQYEDLPPSFRDRFASILCADWSAGELGADVLRRAEDLAEGKYETGAWLRRR